MRFSRFVLPLLLLAGCDTSPDYPLDKEGTWSPPPINSNDRNLRAMIVNPQDLVAGRGEPNALAQEAVRPINKLYSGNRPALPDVTASSIYGVPSSSGGGGGGQ